MIDTPDLTPAGPEAVTAAQPIAPPSPKPIMPPADPAKSGKVEKPRTDKNPAIWGTGRRKTSIARVRLLAGSGTIFVNNKPFDAYFPRESLRLAIRQPLIVTHQLGKHNVLARVEGGGLNGQAGALRLGIARALLQFDPALKTPLRGAGLLTRDPREKERKKYGQKGARKRFQWTKR